MLKRSSIKNFKSITSLKDLTVLNTLLKSIKSNFFDLKMKLQKDKNLLRPKNLIRIKKYFSDIK